MTGGLSVGRESDRTDRLEHAEKLSRVIVVHVEGERRACQKRGSGVRVEIVGRAIAT